MKLWKLFFSRSQPGAGRPISSQSLSTTPPNHCYDKSVRFCCRSCYKHRRNKTTMDAAFGDKSLGLTLIYYIMKEVQAVESTDDQRNLSAQKEDSRYCRCYGHQHCRKRASYVPAKNLPLPMGSPIESFITF